MNSGNSKRPACTVVTALKRLRGRATGIAEIHLRGHEPLRVPVATIVDLGIDAGAVLPPRRLQALKVAADEHRAKSLLKRWLNTADRTAQHLIRSLIDRGIPEAVAQRIVGEFARAGAVDDRRFASTAAADLRTRRGAAAPLIVQTLIQRGVQPQVAASATQAAAAEQSEDECARHQAELHLRRCAEPLTHAAARRVLQGLARRGYDDQQCIDALRYALLASSRSTRVLDEVEGDLQ